MKLAIGLVLAVCVGIGCRWFGIPLPGPPAITGAAMAVAMASGYTLTDYLLTRDSNSAPSVAHFSPDPSGVSLEAALDRAEVNTEAAPPQSHSQSLPYDSKPYQDQKF